MRGGRALILNYHVMRAEQMREHLDFLDDFFELVPLDEALSRAQKDVRPGKRLPAALTFDDGKRSHMTEAAEVLRARGVHATFFVTAQHSERDTLHWFDLADRVGRAIAKQPDAAGALAQADDLAGLSLIERDPAGGFRFFERPLKTMPAAQRDAVLDRLALALDVDPTPQDDDERALTPDEVGRLHRMGFGVGSHSATHPILTLESEERCIAEIEGSRRTIEAWIGEPVRHFCYPNGNSNALTRTLTRRAGYEAAWTTVPLWAGAGDDLHRLPRVQIYPHYDRDETLLKAAMATFALLPNPDGTGREYRRDAA